jgi:hypothetical protein
LTLWLIQSFLMILNQRYLEMMAAVCSL